MLDTPVTATPALSAEPAAAGADPLDNDFPPRERKAGQIAVGAAVVVATAALLLHTALRSADAPAEEPAVGAAPIASSAATAPRPRPVPSTRPARPKHDPADTTARATVSAEPSASAPGSATTSPAPTALPEDEQGADAGTPETDDLDVPETTEPGTQDAGGADAAAR
jgi:serine/threonine-protein kinase